jgi:hypothetical protein
MLRKLLRYKDHARVEGHAEYSVVFATQALVSHSHPYLKFSDRELEDMETVRARVPVSGALVNALAVVLVGSVTGVAGWFVYFCLTTRP